MTNAPNNDDHVGNEDQLQAVHVRLQELERQPRQVSSPEELESLEREIRKETEELARGAFPFSRSRFQEGEMRICQLFQQVPSSGFIKCPQHQHLAGIFLVPKDARSLQT